jgi:hypothetical protein
MASGSRGIKIYPEPEAYSEILEFYEITKHN